MTLYEITDEYMRLLELAEDPETDPEVFADTLEGLQGALEDKADGYGRVIRELEAYTAGLEAEIARLTAKKRTADNSITRMKEALKSAFLATGTAKIKTDLFTITIQRNPAAVVMDEQYIENIPTEYLIEQEPKLNRQKIKEDLKAGKDLQGIAHLEQTEGLRIR